MSLEAALAYAARGWFVFPCGSDKKPLTAHGFKDASQDPAQLQAWWDRWPGAAIGLDCGRSGLVVVDLDVKGGADGPGEWRKLGISEDLALTSMTPSGGWHFIFKDTTGGVIRNSAGKLGPGIDIRANGGYIILPGSQVESGRYEAVGDWAVDPGELPQALVLLLTRPERTPSLAVQPRSNGNGHFSEDAGDHWLQKALERAHVGSRNDTGLWLACQLRDAGMREGEAEGIMQAYAIQSPGGDRSYTEAEALASLRQAYKTPAREPARAGGGGAISYANIDSGYQPEAPDSWGEDLHPDEIHPSIDELIEIAKNVSATERTAALEALANAMIGATPLAVADVADQLKAAGLCLKKVFTESVKQAESEKSKGKVRPTYQFDTRLPTIKTNNRQMRDVTRDALSALSQANKPPVFFVRSGDIVRVRQDERRRPSIGKVEEAALRGRLDRVANFFSEHELNGSFFTKPDKPPLDIVRDMLALGSWEFPALEGITECPTIRPNGTVICTPGYDPSTRLYYQPEPGLHMENIPESPTEADVSAALALLEEAVGDFPYDGPESKANALGLLLTPIVRPAIRGHVPLGLIDAPQAGTGKSLYASVIGAIVSGEAPAIITAPKDRDEWRKKITSALMTGATVVTIDNLTGLLYSGELAAVITTSVWADRLLGSNEIIKLPHHATWLATGNNIRLGGDLPRRCYWIRLDAQMSRPWQREGFKHPDLIAWVLDNRGALLVAALTLARAWYASGCPAPQVKLLGGFSEWTRIIGGILEHAGVSGFLGNLNTLYESADDETPQWEAFLLAMAKRFTEPVTVAAICEAMDGDLSLMDSLPDMLDAILDDKDQARKTFKRKLGHAFSLRNGTRYGDSQVRVERAGADRTKAVTWKFVVERPENASGNAEVAEVAEVVSSPSEDESFFWGDV